MKVLFNKIFLKHNAESEAEGAYRIKMFASKHPDTLADGEAFIQLVHPASYQEQIKQKCFNNEKIAEIQLSPASYEAAKVAVGLTIKASERGDFAVVRPPGHHAGRESSQGFCLFNNIAIAAQKLVNEGKKVMIFDFDAHHGNGTQEIFYQNKDVLYVSVHQSFSFPHTGHAHETGIKEGDGLTMNMPVMFGSGDKEFLGAVDKAIAKGVEFSPDVVGISAGFDAYYKDKMMNMDVSLKSYYEAGFRLGRAFNNIFAVLEGGYHDDIFICVRDFIEGIHVGSRPLKNRFDHNMSIG